jgi:hypothetical protein
MRALIITAFAALSLCYLGACKEKKNEPEKEAFFPALPFIRSQVAHVDTSLYSIMRVVYVDSTRTDTTYLRREQFKDAAVDFLNLPDISTKDFRDRYTEDKQFDETLNRVLLVYTPIKPEQEVIQRQEVLIKPDVAGDQVSSIIVNTAVATKDSMIEKKMLWSVDQNFRVTTIRQLNGQPETTSSYKISWNEDE